MVLFILICTAGASAAPPETVTFTYDDAGRLKEGNFSSAAHVDYQYDAAGNRTALNHAPPDTTPPGAPGVPSFTNLTYQSATANWIAATDNIAIASYEYRLNGGAWQNIGLVTTKALSGLTSSTLYTFEVRALDGAYNAGATSSNTFTTPAPQPGTLSFAPSSYAILEDSTTVVVTVSRTAGTDFAVAVNYATSNGTAVASGDYAATSGTLNWSAGQGGSKQFSVTINEDTNAEADETINLTLSSPTGGATIGAGSGTITINDDEPGVLSLTDNVYWGMENSGSITISVFRNLGTYGAVSVQYATSNGTATAPGDYTATSGTLNWANGDSATKTVQVPITDDSTGEIDETFTFTLSNPVGAPIAINPATVTITDNDSSLPGTPGTPTSNDNPSTDGSYRISWTAPSTGGAFTYYTLQEAGDENFTSPLSWNQSGTSMVRSGMLDGEYYYRVRACNASNQCGGWSGTRWQIVGTN